MINESCYDKTDEESPDKSTKPLERRLTDSTRKHLMRFSHIDEMAKFIAESDALPKTKE